MKRLRRWLEGFVSWRIDVVYAVGTNSNIYIYMNEKFSLEEVDAQFYSALAEFEQLISKGVLNLEESNRKRELEEIMSSCLSEIRRYQAEMRQRIAEFEVRNEMVRQYLKMKASK